jgi:hypothetical protein
MFVSSLYLAVRALLGLLVRSRGGGQAAGPPARARVLRGQLERPKLQPADRALLPLPLATRRGDSADSSTNTP